MLSNRRIKRNELCPCGSKKRYKDCCYDRTDEVIDITHTQKTILDISKMFDAAKFEICLHPNQTECVPPIKHAHSIQNHGILSQISVENHVIARRTNKTTGMTAKKIDNGLVQIQFNMERVGVNNATTLTCFCNYHDSTIFAPIENNEFDVANEEQLFLYCYRAFASEYYKSKVALLAQNNLFKTLPHKLKKNPFLFVRNYRQAQLKDIEMEYYKKFFNNCLTNKDYTQIATRIIEIPYKISFATTECLTPAFNLEGKRIPSITKKLLRRIFITIFPNNSNSYILISYLKTDEKNFSKYVKQLCDLDLDILYQYLSVFLPLYGENLVLSPNLWSKWGSGQTAFTGLINILVPAIFRVEYILTKSIANALKKKIKIPMSKCNLFERI